MLAKSQSESKLVFASSLSLQTGIRITYNSNTNEMRYILYFVLQRMLNLLQIDRPSKASFPPPAFLTFIWCWFLAAVDTGGDWGQEEDGHSHGGDDYDHQELLLLNPRNCQREDDVHWARFRLPNTVTNVTSQVIKI